ncbi:gametocyte-specific factor 1 homolog [Rhopalosiphum maidis]|uniref:gametocyte-specific factor 1 homolog n=1 Tax=Rhopalosiphum maidis TaxID=43146 RepID=UPI000EFF1FE1|nr:gametocyte-specific factor 1 homolog [Rhopalosiphum maidis]
MESVHLGQNTKSNVVHCPFNISHTMPQKTLLLHLTKCPDKKPNQSICTFNNLHVVHSSLIKEHEEQCPNRLNFDQILYKTTDDKIAITYKGKVEPFEDSTWDDDDSNINKKAQGVSENTIINQTGYFMKPQLGLTKSERKKFRQKAQQTLSNVDLSYNPNLNINDRQNSKSNAGKLTNQSDQSMNRGLFFGKKPNT